MIWTLVPKSTGELHPELHFPNASLNIFPSYYLTGGDREETEKRKKANERGGREEVY